MLLEHHLSVTLHERAARVWSHRERIEREAAGLFAVLGRELREIGHAELAKRAAAAAVDEQRHAVLCQELVTTLGAAPPPTEVARAVALGPSSLSQHERVVYAAVAVGCVTESLSCALLLALRHAATHPLVRETIDQVLKDEIEHARIGWAVLAAESARRDVRWIASYLPSIAAAAVDEDIRPMLGDDELAGLGVLPRARVHEVVSETWTSVIGPGLARHGIAVPVHAWRLQAGA
jgi:hypothetical protein